ncbi:sensor histidine kinase [Paracraurococcus lichenis]|uniref:histidine kinase n=1 Tax=Paracraurococcus lichenis TaxID=3064888 RepID=A0ABT9E6X5_9PROT|nr:sensor histidine kinase [Paracraurococcus sp. LOR1-02]MDO9711878.1 sensor histidine kinase [Paracraurococcus sp. LOR1-02]
MRRLTLRARMALLVLAGVLPILAWDLGGVYLGYARERERASAQALDLTRAISGAVAAELRARSAALGVLALSRSLMADDLAAFRAQAEKVVASQLPGATLLLRREDGQQLMNTALPPGEPPPRQAWTTPSRTPDAGRPSVSDVYFGPVLRRPVVAVEVPVKRPEGQADLVLVMIPSADAFDAVIRRQRLRAGWIASVIDSKGVRIARQPDPERFVGQPVTPEFLAVWLSGGPEGVVETVSPDGIPVLTAFTRLPEVGWGVVVAIPTSELTRPALEAAVASLLVGAVLLGFGLALARWAAKAVIQPFAALRRIAASADDAGSAPDADGTGLPEADEVAEALRTQARCRRAATASLLESERRLRLVVAELNHRAKNALATVQSLALQTARGEAGGDPARFSAEFGARLQALARAHDLLVASRWEPAALDAIVRAGLAPWLGGEGSRLILRCRCGAEVPPAAPGQAQALVMALHELATNAAKHGALSTPDGRVEVTCRAEEAGLAAVVEWCEVGGPPVRGPPPRRGFGVRLLERALARDLGPGGIVTLDFDPGGVRAGIRFRCRDHAEFSGEILDHGAEPGAPDPRGPGRQGHRADGPSGHEDQRDPGQRRRGESPG